MGPLHDDEGVGRLVVVGRKWRHTIDVVVVEFNNFRFCQKNGEVWITDSYPCCFP